MDVRAQIQLVTHDWYVQDLTNLVKILIFVGKTQPGRIVRQVNRVREAVESGIDFEKRRGS